MVSSVLQTSLFTALFLATGVYSVVQLAALASGVSPVVDRAAELSHLLMSVAMIAMTLGWSGGPSSPSGVLQIGAFAFAGLYFLIAVVRGHRPPVAGGHELVMSLAMVWMVVGMPALMGSAGSSGATMEDMPWMSAGATAGAGPDPAARSWMLPVSLLLIALLVATTLFWAARVRTAAGPIAHRGNPCGADADAVTGAGAVTGADPRAGAAPLARAGGGVVTATGLVGTARPRPVASLLSPRAGAVCHAVMSAGMAAMLAAML